MARPAARDLTERELEVMHVFWKAGEATAAEARDRLAAAGRDRTYPTIANLVRSLHDKGFLEPTNAERPFSYQPVRSYEEHVARALLSEGFKDIATSMLFVKELAVKIEERALAPATVR